jgi:hypothetical protein
MQYPLKIYWPHSVLYLNLKVFYVLKKEPPLKTFFELYLSLSDIFMRFSCKNQYNFYGWSTNFGLVDFTWIFCNAFLGIRDMTYNAISLLNTLKFLIKVGL